MTTVNLNIKIKSGPQTPVKVDIYSTSANEKQLKFINGKTLSEKSIVKWLEDNLTKILKDIESREI